jgi:sialate O-acetylesterase
MKTLRCLPFVLAAMTLTLMACPARAAELKLSHVFGDHMVLQREKPVKVWGWAEQGTTVMVEFAGQKRTATATDKGDWLVTLDPLPASAAPRELVVSASGSAAQTIKCADVLVGDVWLLGGQSNMQMPLWRRSDGFDLAKADFPLVRLMTVPESARPVAQDDIASGVAAFRDEVWGTWFVCKPGAASATFSALGFFIGQRLQEKLGIPIGLVDASWGGTLASAWVPRAALEAIPEARAMLKEKDAAAAAWSAVGGRTQFTTAPANQEASAAKAKKQPAAGKSKLKTDPTQERNFPSASFNGMIYPLRHLAIRGVFFYQGENNCISDTDLFPQTYTAVVNSWRAVFEDRKLPFCLFQIAGWGPKLELNLEPKINVAATKAPLIQEAQLQIQMALPNTGFVVTTDHAHTDIHPLAKQPIAERAVRWALAEVYGQPGITWGTPVYQSMKRDGKRLILNFRTPGKQALKITGEPAGFVIAGKDGKFVAARAEVVERTSVAVWSDQVADPVAVRYAWSRRPICHLYTESGLPAGPFRTDDKLVPSARESD